MLTGQPVVNSRLRLATALRVEYAEPRQPNGILLVFSLFREYIFSLVCESKPLSDQFPVRVCSCPLCIINRL